jgi:hypothetical protein
MVLGMVFLTSCNSSNTPSEKSDTSSSSHHIEILEVLQPGGYTYLYVAEGDKEYWIATDRTDAKVGDDFYYKQGMEMKDFTSKELDRTFETIYFVDKLSTVPILDNQPANAMQNMSGRKPVQKAEDIKVEPVEGGITIAELYKNRNNYDGKQVIVTGHVVKVNEAIMNLNWIHLQDGTKDGENFDLTITTEQQVTLHEIVTFEGTVALNKDFGAGYTYELIVENGRLK